MTAAIATAATQIKEKMANMPDSLDTKKEVEAYFKDAMKNLNVDDKPKKGLNSYQQFVKDNSKSVKEQNPELTGKQVFSLIAKMWKELYGDKKEKSVVKPTEDTEDVSNVEEEKPKEEIEEVPEVKETKPKAKAEPKKKK